MATKQDIRNEGFRRGQAVASWVDMPEIGAKLSPAVDWVGYRYVTQANQFNVWEMLCQDQGPGDMPNELHVLSFTKPYDVEEVFRAGFEAGIAAYGRRHHAAQLENTREEF